MFRSHINYINGERFLSAKSGTEMDDKSIVIGISPNTGKQLVLAGILRSDWLAANHMAPRISSRNIFDMRMARQEELEVLYAAKGMGVLADKFDDVTNRGHAWMWSGDTINYATKTAWVKSLLHGGIAGHNKENVYIVPLVKEI